MESSVFQSETLRFPACRAAAGTPASSLASGFLPFNVLTVKYRLCFPPQPRWRFNRANQNGSRGQQPIRTDLEVNNQSERI